MDTNHQQVALSPRRGRGSALSGARLVQGQPTLLTLRQQFLRPLKQLVVHKALGSPALAREAHAGARALSATCSS